MKHERDKEQIESVNTALKWTKDEAILRNLSTMELSLVIGLERGESRDGVEPIEDAIEGHEVVGSIVNSDSGDGSPGEEGGGGDREAGKEEAFQGNHNGGVFKEEPLELKRGPYADKEGGVCAEEGSEDGDG